MIRIAFALALMAALAVADGPEYGPPAPSAAPVAWPPEALDAMARLPVQDEGRVKPLSTMAGFSMLRIHYKRTFRVDDAKLAPTEWLLRVLLRPDVAVRDRVFLVENDEVIQALGLPTEGKKRRDRYSYEELRPGRDRLAELGREYSHIDAKERTPVQGQLVILAQNVFEFERYLHYLDFARSGVPVPPALAERFGGEATIALSEGLATLPELRGRDPAAAGRLGEALLRHAWSAQALAILPPADRRHDHWMTPSEVAEMAQAGMPVAPAHLEMIAGLEALVDSRNDADAFARAATKLQADVAGIAERRGEYEGIELEVSFYRLDPFTKSLVLYLLGFLLVAATWIWPRAKWLVRGAVVVMVAGLAIHTAGITIRCILRGRPPVTTLYETVLFVTGGAVLTCLIIEWINRRRIALSASPMLGALGLFVAMRFEVINRTDTMPQLIAVLDTNFWLATHVTCITLGYSAGLLAAAIAHVPIFGRLFGLKRHDPGFYRGVNKIIYGVLGFALIFSVVGTILGGVWANDSWGRFWGWDPKENGALMIVLAQLAILHGRLGGYVKGLGLSAATIVQGCIVAFSWWGVNLLGVGLHSYGFTEGVWTGLLSFWGFEGLVLGAAGVAALIPKKAASAA